ncbi:elongation factor P [Candidatus Berkelbacteria bacterium]|nr:elongation factor P [Candidatus Berkelbacteria bacterium]
MLSLNQVRSGAKIIFRDAPHEVLEANHLKVGRGGAKLVTKMRNLLSGAVIDFTFAGDEKLESADLLYKSAQYLYAEGEKGFCMTNDDFETLELPITEREKKYLKEGESVDLITWQGRAIGINIPKKVTLKVTYTEPGFKGNTASAALKKATLETGATVMVPLFININDNITINTDSGDYCERVK